MEKIKMLRLENNKAIEQHDIEKMPAIWMNDMVLVRGNSTHVTGKDTIVATWKRLFLDNEKVYYVRTPTVITISPKRYTCLGNRHMESI